MTFEAKIQFLKTKEEKIVQIEANDAQDAWKNIRKKYHYHIIENRIRLLSIAELYTGAID